MEKEPCVTKTEPNMKVSGSRIRSKAKDCLAIVMGPCMRGSGVRISGVEKGR